MDDTGPNVRALGALKGLAIACRRYGGKEAALAAMNADPALAESYLKQGLAYVETCLAGMRRDPDFEGGHLDDERLARMILRLEGGHLPDEE